MLSSHTPSRKARFFKCALQVNPARYIEYRGKTQTLSEDDYNQQMLSAAQEAGIEVIGLADHGSVDAVDKIRDLFTQQGIVVFPGFEIASSEKIHFVCLFDETKTSQALERILGCLRLLDPQEGTRPSRLSAEQLIDEINKQGGFIFAAHSTGNNGVLQCKSNHVWQYKGLLAAQIPGSIDDLKGVESDFYRRAFLNKDLKYRRERAMAAINAADVAQPDDIKKANAACLIKMTQPCFASFKQAFLDADSRVRLNTDKPENYASAIERMRMVGGYLDGLDIQPSEHLNALIGGRGTGKSTLIECIRFVLNLEPVGKAAKAQHDAVLKNNLGREKAWVEITLRSATMQGRQFKVSRKWGDQPIVQDDQGHISPHEPSDLLPGIELYGQNEIYEITRNPQSRHRLIKRFLAEEPHRFDATITQVQRKLEDNRAAILKALQQRSTIEEDVEQLPKLQDQATQFQTLGLHEKLKIIPQLEKEKQHNARVQAEIDRIREAIASLKDSLPDSAFLSDKVLEGLPHANLLKQQRVTLDQITSTLNQGIQQLAQQIQQTEQSITPVYQQIQAGIRTEEQTLEKALQAIPASQGKTGREIGSEYQTLLQKIAQIQPQQTALETRQAQINALYDQRTKLLLERSEAISAHSSMLQKSVKQLNRKLEQKVQLTLHNEGNRQPLFDFLVESKLEAVGPKRLAWVTEGDFSPTNLAATLRAGEDTLQKQKKAWELSPTVMKALCQMPESRLLHLEELLLPDTLAIALNVIHDDAQIPDFRPLEDLSTGQQCTAVLHLLLMDNLDPLILDQPEDNLDNAFIAERIVAELRRAKLNRQFLFATHNANIPVFGDAEWIGVLSVADKKGRITPEQQGAIDVPAVQQMAADILEGGENAFNQRREKYGYL